MFITQMTETELYEFGKQIAGVARDRPDIVHRLLLGMRHEFERQDMFPGLGDLLHALWRHARHDMMGINASGQLYPDGDLKIPFLPINEAPSGYGKYKA